MEINSQEKPKKRWINGKENLAKLEKGNIQVKTILYMENIIRSRRKELGLSQEELAKRCGVSRQTINAIENNKYDPTLSLAFRLASELLLTVDTLFTPSV